VWVENLTAWDLASPTLFVLGTIYIMGPVLPMARQWVRAFVFAIVALVVVRYVQWRIFDTVLPASGPWYQVTWIWFCLGIELLFLFDTSIVYLTFLRKTNRTPEADLHEARLLAMSTAELPWVDVYIPTYNEPAQVLEKTIVGVSCLDYPNFKIWVLDDGRRPWLKDYCEAKGVGYLTRPDNAHAKAGNINHALTKTSAEFVAVFDADFIPQRNFLMRALGFFEDPKVGIVQIPHTFYNHDPMQANLSLGKALPHDQSFFFQAILASRDGWDTAFCCGSNSILRRAALREIGGAFPTESVTEDILLTISLLRHGYVTRFLNERLAYGLAPESLDAFFVQRQRWARGGIQIMYLATGPLGRRLSLVQRLMFLPTHWLSQSPAMMLSLVAPLVFLWTGVVPFVHVTTQAEIFYFLPTVIAIVGGQWLYAPRYFSPLAAYVLSVFQSFRLLLPVLETIVRPFGHIFKVTPKGRNTARRQYDRGIFWAAIAVMVLTAGGLIINTFPEYRIVSTAGLLPIAALLGGVNIMILFLICMISLEAPVRRAEERFEIDEPIQIFNPAGTILTGRSKDMSLTGAGIFIDESEARVAVGDSIQLYIAEVGFVVGAVIRHDRGTLGVQFDLPHTVERDLLIRKMFTSGIEPISTTATAWSATVAMLKTIWFHQNVAVATAATDTTTEETASTKLAAESLVVPPRRRLVPLSVLGEQRRLEVAA
jgi:cellulose synthase (UDP-forming)